MLRKQLEDFWLARLGLRGVPILRTREVIPKNEGVQEVEKDPSIEEIKRVMRYLGTRTAPTKRSEASRKAAASMDPNVKTARAKKAAAVSAAVRSAKAKARKGDPQTEER